MDWFLLTVFLVGILVGVLTNVMQFLGNMFINFSLSVIAFAYQGYIAPEFGFPLIPKIAWVFILGYVIGTFGSRILRHLGLPTP